MRDVSQRLHVRKCSNSPTKLKFKSIKYVNMLQLQEYLGQLKSSCIFLCIIASLNIARALLYAIYASVRNTCNLLTYYIADTYFFFCTKHKKFAYVIRTNECLKIDREE